MIFSTCWVGTPLAFAANDCSCPQIQCNSCQIQSNLEFYTEKCGRSGRVKSCSRPLCVDQNPLPKNCQASQPDPNQRVPASTVTAKVKAPNQPKTPLGTVILAIGHVFVNRDNTESRLYINNKVFEGDAIRTSPDAKFKAVLLDKSEVLLMPNSKTVLNKKLEQKSEGTVIELMYGTVRSKVTKASLPNPNGFKFEVHTPSAVAGVRGTDFVTTYYEGSQITKVQTLEGEVQLSDKKRVEKVNIPGGYYASFVLDSQSPDRHQASLKYVDEGFLTPLAKLNTEQLKDIVSQVTDEPSKEMAVIYALKEPVICSKPSAQFNQCSWQCVGNSRKNKNCRTDLPNVRCVRKRCNANGEWAEETRLPAQEAHDCPAHGLRVERCDY